ncbi:MAG TPA: tRNA dihydrouridine synthase DusB [Candidatus Avacidaminococcus intestinavium]|uniref:tRNA-dihydrouridine synthase n=1 Tax=Candidatus Avacidaminococcus intestinavium TaxID=2840684 RepID=A0A9D1MPK9_9FIRM|nr:tRNA dihydrouridine synthase DusB [Candidatus Avacidaminococcus intestinavium]
MFLGKLEVKIPVVLAPMAGITDLPFRLLCRELGSGFTISEMVSAKGLLHKNDKTFAMLRIEEKERPTAIQLFGSDPRELAEAAAIVEKNGADIVDFNMGCPVPKIVNNGEGSALMKNPELAYEILARMVDAVQIPVTVKFRSGWNEKTMNAEEIARKAELAGVSAVAVHARTREQHYSGTADWQVIRAVKEVVKIPVFGNGDIKSLADGKRMIEETNCDGLMLGRGVDGNPWLFRDFAAYFKGEPQPEPVALEERFAFIIRHFSLLIAHKGEVVATKEMRRHLTAYSKGLPYAAEYRGKFNAITDFEQAKKILDEYLQKLIAER